MTVNRWGAPPAPTPHGRYNRHIYHQGRPLHHTTFPWPLGGYLGDWLALRRLWSSKIELHYKSQRHPVIDITNNSHAAASQQQLDKERRKCTAFQRNASNHGDESQTPRNTVWRGLTAQG